MSNSTESATPGQRFRHALQSGCLPIPGVFNALSARLAERHGFRALYQSGAALSAGTFALPDIGLITQTEFAQQAQHLTNAVTIPVISDADTGFGPPLSVERTVRQFEDAGLAGLHLEDQELPKRCGHLSGKSLVDREAFVAKISAAVAARRDPGFVIIARTDARGVLGFDKAIERAQACVDAGADMIFPEALETPEEFRRFAREIKAPLLANMTEFGKSPLLTVTQLADLGYAAVLFPVTLLRAAMKAVDKTLQELATTGSQRDLLPALQTRAELYELLDYDGYDARDRVYFGGQPAAPSSPNP